jgi:hypothetical protein
MSGWSVALLIVGAVLLVWWSLPYLDGGDE